jgi:putative ABC transport system ATP-binding protein
VMQHLRKEHGVTFLFSTHDKRVMNHAERIVTLTDGKISEDKSL